MQTRLDLEALRDHFPTLRTTIYLNSGSYGLLHDSVRQAFEDYLNARVDRGADWDDWAMRAEAVRSRMATLLNVTADEMAITASASAGMNSLASALDFSGARNRIVVSNYEFPTSGQVWHAQAKRGARIVHAAERGDGVIAAEDVVSAIDERTKLVVLSHVCYRHGAKFSAADIKAIAAAAHANGALLFLDCYQSVGSESIDLADLDVDFAGGGMLKYLIGTAGIGFLYVRRSLVEDLVPASSGWFAQAEANMLNIFANEPHPTARRFQAGTPPVPSCYAATAGLDVILDVSTDVIGDHVRSVTRYALDELAAAGFSVATPDRDSHRGPMIAVRARDEAALVDALIDERIVTSSRSGNIRAGFHFYNNRRDVDGFVAALDRHRRLLV